MKATRERIKETGLRDARLVRVHDTIVTGFCVVSDYFLFIHTVYSMTLSSGYRKSGSKQTGNVITYSEYNFIQCRLYFM
jgi:hypothetical protein